MGVCVVFCWFCLFFVVCRCLCLFDDMVCVLLKDYVTMSMLIICFFFVFVDAQHGSDQALVAADSKLQALSEDARKKAWEHDTLQFARDVAQVGKLYSMVDKSDKAERVRKVTHIRSENTIGGSIVEIFMSQHACH